MGDVNKLFDFKSLLASYVLPFHLKKSIPPVISIFTESESDGMESTLFFFNLIYNSMMYCDRMRNRTKSDIS